MKHVVIIDNYDSFTYNLVQAVAMLDGSPRITVRRNDQVSALELQDFRPTHLIVSPGPCTPKEAGNSVDIIRRWAGKIPILGVCLGHQCIAAAFGIQVVRADRCMHGKTSQIRHDGRTIFEGLDNPFTAMRYHSLIVKAEGLDSGRGLPEGKHPLRRSLVVTASSERGEIMGIRHEPYRIEGVQFHPESFATPAGPKLLENFLRLQAPLTPPRNAPVNEIVTLMGIIL